AALDDEVLDHLFDQLPLRLHSGRCHHHALPLTATAIASTGPPPQASRLDSLHERNLACLSNLTIIIPKKSRGRCRARSNWATSPRMSRAWREGQVAPT